ncbi:MAG: IS21 family transposase, partial [Mesorhizobium sp.]
VRHAGEVVADHALCRGRRQRIVERAHLAGVVGAAAPVRSAPVDIVAPSALLRPLAECEALVGGSW